MTAFVARHEFDIAPYTECYVKDRQKMSAVNIRVASWSTHQQRAAVYRLFDVEVYDNR